jgi:hypothetical protein
VLEAALLTLTQRLAPDDVLARVFGVQETIFVVGTALGGLIAATLIALLGLDVTLVVTGLALPSLAVLLRRRLGRLEAGAAVPERAYTLLRGLPMFAPLPIAMIENLATRAETQDHPTGTEIIRQGEEGDWFDVIDEGTLEVVLDGRVLLHRGAGECGRRDRPLAVSAPDGHGSRHYARAPCSPGSDRLPRRGLLTRSQHPSRRAPR